MCLGSKQQPRLLAVAWNSFYWITYDAALTESMLNFGSTVTRSSETQFHGVLVIIGGVVHATHHSLIIPKEEDGKTGDTIDQYQKTALLVLVYHIVLADVIHSDNDK